METKFRAVVIGEDHYNTLNVVRALGQDGIHVIVIVFSQKKKNFVLKSKFVSESYVVGEQNDILIALDGIWNKYNQRIPIITTCDSMAAFMDSNYLRLSDKFVLPSVGCSQGNLSEMMDKNIQLRLAKISGFDVPQSIPINLSSFNANEITEINYPCIIKPEESIAGSKNDFRICGSKEELLVAFNELKKHISHVLVQDFIPNDEVILVAGVRTQNNENYIFGEINKTKHGKGLNSLGLNCMGILSPKNELGRECRMLVDSIDYHGCYSIEVIRTSSKSNAAQRNYFLEINLRTDGLFYFYTKAGINLPSIWVKSCYDAQFEVTPATKDIYGMNEFLYLKNNLSFSSIKDFMRADTFSLFSWKDLKPFIYKFIYHG